MKKRKKAVILKLLLPVIAFILIVSVIVTAISETEKEIMALFSSSTESGLMLQCEGTYENKNCSVHIWSSEIDANSLAVPSDIANRAVAWAKSAADVKKYKYVTYNKAKVSCPACGKGNGWNCIGFVSAAYHHSGLKSIKCSNSGIGFNTFFTNITIKSWREKNGKDWIMIDNGGSKGGSRISESKLKPGDILICYNGSGIYKHVAMYAGDGMICDCTPSRGPAYRKYSKLGNKPTRAFRYTGGDGVTDPVTDSITSTTPAIDFTATGKKQGNGYYLSNNEHEFSGELRINGNNFTLIGTISRSTVEITGSVNAGKITGTGYMLNESALLDDPLVGKATYVGTDDADTSHSIAVLFQTGKYSNSNNPYFKGYGGKCELWTSKIYKEAGLSYTGSCCAYSHSKKTAHKTGAIPKGALIFSGQKPNGSMYENGHRSSAMCNTCGHWAGHVAIYIGGGLVAGSQVPYLYSVDAWIDSFGYGGWSLN